MQEQLIALKKQNNVGEEKAPSMLPPLVEGKAGYFINHDLCGDGIVYCDESDLNFFPTKELAEAYADAFKVVLELRRQPFSGEVDGEGRGYIFCGNGFGYDWYPYDTYNMELFQLCPPFPSPEACEAAVEAVGRERIIKAYRLLANVKE